jgi:hypothetical protein
MKFGCSIIMTYDQPLILYLKDLLLIVLAARRRL